MSGGNNIQALGVGGLYATQTVYGGGGGGIVTAKDTLDWARMGFPGRTPEAEYPDGYVSTGLNSRRSDRLLSKIGSMNRRSYTRGVHRGSKVDPGDYIWPENWNPQRGIQAEMAGRQAALAAEAPEPRLSMDARMAPPSPVAPPSPTKSRQLQALLPAWV